MDVVVDVVRGEGRVAGKKEWPLWLVLGDDAIEDVRERVEKLAKMTDAWADMGRSLKVE